MITEDYVSYETAKLLKEKGFKGEFHKHYWGYENGKEFLTEGSFNPEYDYSAPTLQVTMKWLREVHNLSVEVYRTACGYVGCIVAIPNGTDIKFSGQYTKWEYACESAIKYCLKNLI